MEAVLRKTYTEAMKTYEQAIVAWNGAREAITWVSVAETELYQRLWAVEDKAHQAMNSAWNAKERSEKLLMEKGWLW